MTNIADMLLLLKQSQAALGDSHDLRTDNERADYWAKYNTHQRVISGLMNLPADIARAQQRIDDLQARRAVVVAKQAELEAQITDVIDWRDARERDAEYDRQRGLRLCLQRLHEGTLFASPGVAFERLTDLDARITEFTARRDRAQTALDSCLAQAERLVALSAKNV